jgi:hypothetical protein
MRMDTKSDLKSQPAVKLQLSSAEENAKALQKTFLDVVSVKHQEETKAIQIAKHYGALTELYSDLGQVVQEGKNCEELPTEAIASGDNALRSFRQFIDTKKVDDFNLSLLSQIYASTAYIGTSAATISTLTSPLKQPAYLEVLTGKDLEKRNLVKMKLPHGISKSFSQAWESFDHGNYSPEQGASYLMRDTVTQFLHYYAPDEEVKGQNWFIPRAEGNPISRRHRIEFITRRYFPEDQWEHRRNFLLNLDDIYTELCKAHNSFVLSRPTCEVSLQAATDVFYSFYLSQEK